ncbi:hypothetical protein Tco_0648651, partial [Tanacetum coccineum]
HFTMTMKILPESTLTSSAVAGNLLRRFIHESNPDDVGTNNGLTTSSNTVRLTIACSYSSFNDIQLASKIQEIKKAQNKQR